MNGNDEPGEVRAAAGAADEDVRVVLGSSICICASSPITVWCMRTWLSTEPSAYFVSSRGAAASTASEIAMPRLPVESGCSARIARPAFVSSDGLGDDAAAERLDQPAPVRLLVVRDPTM